MKEYQRLRKQVENEQVIPIGATLRLVNDNHAISRPLKQWMHNKAKVLERDGYKCYICHKTTNLHVHHIIPRQEGGTDEMENLITLCAGCHKSVESGDSLRAIRSCVRRAVVEARKSLSDAMVNEDCPESTKIVIDDTEYSTN